MKQYRKFLVALGAAVTVAISVSADGTVDTNDVWAIVLAALGSLGVYRVPNTPKP